MIESKCEHEFDYGDPRLEEDKEYWLEVEQDDDESGFGSEWE